MPNPQRTQLSQQFQQLAKTRSGLVLLEWTQDIIRELTDIRNIEKEKINEEAIPRAMAAELLEQRIVDVIKRVRSGDVQAPLNDEFE